MQLFDNLNISRYDWAAQCLQELLPKSPSCVVSDIGAGNNIMRSVIEQYGGKWQGFDLIPQSTEIQKWDFSQSPHCEFPMSGLALCLDVLEHLENPWISMQNISSILLSGAFLIISTPNPKWSRSRFLNLAQGYLSCFTQSDLDLNHHVFVVWPHILERLLADTGFEIVRYVTLDGSTAWPQAPYNFRYPLRCGFAILNMIVERNDPTACGMSYGVIARKK
jgi:hypothetical protein